MIHALRFRLAAIVAVGAFILVTATVALAAGKVGSASFNGEVQHVSTTNIKVMDPKTKTAMSFLILPQFKRVFSSDGKTTAQMSSLHPGQYVKVYYDQKALGIRHADRILILNNANEKMGK
ncbi:MAG: hypothetical protein ABR591_13310, partial [Candidatus Velthaea sp.]